MTICAELGEDAPVGREARSRHRFFASRADEPRSRRATDLIVLSGATVALALLGALAQPQPGVERSFMLFVASLPSAFGGLWRFLITVLAIWALLLLVITAAARRWTVLRDLALAALVAFTLSMLLGRLVLSAWPQVWDSLRALGPARYFPPMSLAIPVAIAVTASPHLSAPARRVGRWLILGALLGAVCHQTAAPIGAFAAIFVGAAGAAAVHLAFGSCSGRPSLSDVSAALAGLGVRAQGLGVAQRQTAGLFEVKAVDESRRPLVIKVYGRDANDTQLLTTVWRTIWYREAGSPSFFGRRSQVEHEALLSLLAAQDGIVTSPVVAAGATDNDDVVLVLREVGVRLREQPELWSEALAAACWEQLAHLHRIGIVHGQLDDENLIIDDGRLGLIDFRGGSLTPSREQLRTDQAQLLVTTVLALGPDAALPTALDALGPGELAALLPFVQPTALTAAQRSAIKTARLDLDKLRTQAAELAGTTAPQLQRLQRVSVRSLVQIVLLLGAFFAVAAVVGELDLEALAEQMRDATVWLVVTGLIIGQLPRLTSAVSVLGAAPSPLPLGPVYALQLATSYLTLAVPTSAARFAVNIRFLQRHGMRADTALVVSAIDTLSQSAVQFAMLGILLLFTSASLHLEFGGNVSSEMWVLIAIIAVVAVLAVVAVFLVPKWRRAIVGALRGLIEATGQALRNLRSPRRLALLLSANIGTEMLFAITLQVFARSFGYQIGLVEILVITISVRILTGIVPIPGGIGVAESGLAFGLVRAGMPDDVAFAAMLLYRLATFYLPPIWGFFALRWLERNKHL